MAGSLEEWTQTGLGHVFHSPRLLYEALTHTTFTNENPGAPANQRLEFLGDAVVGMVVAQYIFEQFPDLPEGELTKIRAAVVCEPTLAARSRALGVGEHMRFGKGESVSGRDRDSILADALEALVGALFIDGGLEVARSFLLRELAPLIAPARSGLVRVDYKTRLQEWLQERYPEGPAYRLLTEEGPAHNRRFQAGVYHRGEELGTGWGRSKKEAEQEAARGALDRLVR
ncbi:MAG TPA: ribonuclease III [Symbiobacteriaceae bacterium]|nr:ribonuclease III [Symbiobacteriaceae bacterium]